MNEPDFYTLMKSFLQFEEEMERIEVEKFNTKKIRLELKRGDEYYVDNFEKKVSRTNSFDFLE